MKLKQVAFLLPFILLTGCGGDASLQNNQFIHASTPPEISDIRKAVLAKFMVNKEKWALRNLNSYQYEYKMVCVCDIVLGNPTQVRVSEKIVTEAFNLQTSDYLTPEQLQQIKTVDELFGVIAQALQQTQISISITYQDEYGYPEKITVNYEVNDPDSEITYSVKDLI